MGVIRTALAAVAILGVLGAVFGVGSDDDNDVIAQEFDSLRGCGTMRWNDPRPDCVRRLQRALQAHGAPITATAFYLAETTKYVTEFQTGHGLPADGVVDGRTLAALADLPHDPAGWDLRRACVSLRRPTGGRDGSRGRCVTTLRARLSDHGIPAGHGDTFDDDAAAAVTAFQVRAGLPPIGVAGPLTRRALYDAPTPPSGLVQSCTPRGCVILLRREVTRDIAAAFPDDPLVRTVLANVVGAAVCALVRGAPGVNVVCQAVGSYIIDTVAEQTNKAAAQQACLRVDVGYPRGQTDWFPLKIAPAQGAGCRD